MSELKCPHCGEVRDNAIDYDWLAYHEQDCEVRTLTALVASLRSEVETLRAELERERAQRKWVSVEERLPELRQDVLTSIGLVGFCVGRAAAWYESSAGNSIRGVTHWMPIPPAPDAQGKL